MMSFRTSYLLAAALLTAAIPAVAQAQASGPSAPAASESTAAQAARDDPDRDFNRNQPDFVVITLPTTLPLLKVPSR